MKTHLYSFQNRRELIAALKFFNPAASQDDYPTEELNELEKLSYYDFLKEFEDRYGLLIKHYREQKRLRSLTIIKNIIIFYLILSIIAALIWIIYFSTNA